MPIPKYDGSPEQEWIASCMHEIGKEYDQSQALAICYKQMEMTKVDLVTNENVSDEQKLLDSLPEPTKSEGEEAYIKRCIPCLYPDLYDQQQAASFCADHYANMATMGLKKQIMKAQPQSPFDRKKQEFQLLSAERELRLKGVELADYPWEECIADMTERYDAETAPKVCGMIKAKYGQAKE